MSVAALAAPAIVLAASQGASAATYQAPVFSPWQSGATLPADDPVTGLPIAQEGLTWEALPPGSLLANLQAGQQVPLTSPDHAQPDASGNVNLVAVPRGCVAEVYKKLGTETTDIGQQYVTTSGIDSQWVYKSGQSTTAGVDGSINNPNGGFSADGSVSVSSGATLTYPLFTAKTFNRYTTGFLAEEWKFVCTGYDTYTLQEYQWITGAGVDHPSGAPGAKYCSLSFAKGSSYSQNRDTASTFGVGWSALDFGMFTQTGYDTSAAANFKFVSTDGYICGTVNYPPASGVDVAHS